MKFLTISLLTSPSSFLLYFVPPSVYYSVDHTFALINKLPPFLSLFSVYQENSWGSRPGWVEVASVGPFLASVLISNDSEVGAPRRVAGKGASPFRPSAIPPGSPLGPRVGLGTWERVGCGAGAPPLAPIH